MTITGVLCLIITLLVFILLQRRGGAPPELVFLGGLVAVVLIGAITPAEALEGFANPAVLTIGALFVVAAGLRSTGALDLVGQHLLGPARTEAAAFRKLSPPIVALSAMMNNTPIVAMLVPIVMDWCRRVGISPSRMLMPISYLAILGGTCTLIGTSTNLVINGLLLKANLRGMHLFEIGYVGIPCAIVGSVYLLLIGRRFVPDRKDLIETLGEHRREYLVEMLVRPECRLIGQTIEKAGLRNLQGLFLIEIDREGEVITPVTPRDEVRSGDRLVFTGVVNTIVDLEKIPGLVPAADGSYEAAPSQVRQRHLTEVVLSNSSPLIGSTVKQANFRALYNAAVVAVHRNGVRVTNKIGNIRLESGDTLLLQTSTDFANSFRHSRDFYLVSSVEGSNPRRHDRVWVAASLLALLVLSLAAISMVAVVGSSWPVAAQWLDSYGWTSPAMVAMIAVLVATLMIGTGCVTAGDARESLDLQVLVTIAAAVGLGFALDKSGAAGAIAKTLVQLIGSEHPFLLLLVVYFLTLVFTELITNSAVAALMFPLAVAIATQGGLDPRPFAIAIAIAASSSFITPIGYQTNLMVMGPGGYRPRDYLRAGLPLTILIMVTALALIPQIWPLAPSG